MTKTHVSGDAAPTPRVRPVSAGGAQGVARRAERKEATMAPTPEPVDDKPVEQRFAEFMVAMNMKDWPAAQAQLYALAKRLPPQATALLRAQGWYDLQRGELAAARQSYQLLLDRLPNDEESALNMASIYSQQGKGDAARDTLARAVQLRPDSVRLRDALRRFTPEVRP
jgi:tetratricopeptide (TPR) repeat protein